MTLTIDGRPVEAQPGESLLTLVRKIGADADALSRRPLAAKIAGEVFTLNYIPVREQEAQSERPSMRRAMAASNGVVRLLRYSDAPGRECYTRTAQFAVFLALRQLWPEAKGKISCSLGSSVYIQVSGAPDFSAEKLKEGVEKIVREGIPLIRRRVPLQDAVDRFRREGQEDKA